MNIHIPDKDIKESILKDNPVIANVKETKVFDNYIEWLLTENIRKVLKSSTHKQSLKVVQKKMLHILGLLSQIWVIMKNENLPSSGCRGEKVQEMTIISSLFEQKTLLIPQAFHSVTHYFRENIPSTFIDNLSKVKEILKDPDMAVGNISNGTCLFGDKLE